MVEQWPHVIRIAWLTGGLVAVSEPRRDAVIRAGFRGSAVLSAPLKDYRHFPSVVSTPTTTVIGVTFIEDAEEMSGLRPPEFRFYSKGEGWLFAEAAQSWSEIAHHAAQADKMDLMDVTSRISSVLRAAEQRTLALATAYSTQLGARSQSGKVEQYARFQDLHSGAVYLAIHALFWELAVLRDTLAEFVGKFAFALPNVTRWGGLMKNLKDSYTGDLGELRQRLAAASELDGWVSDFTAYRNFFTHNAPMQEAVGAAFAIQDVVDFGEVKVPNLYYALPREIQRMAAARKSNGSLYKTFHELLEASKERKPIRGKDVDALYYLHNVARQFGLLARDLLQWSPTDAEPIELSEKNLIGPIQILRRGGPQ